jgi:hypothetical protein
VTETSLERDGELKDGFGVKKRESLDSLLKMAHSLKAEYFK